MNESVVSIVLNVIRKDDKILMIKRTLGDYIGYFGLPGGKVEVTEHLSGSAVREALEETNIKTKFNKLLGMVSEHLLDEDRLKEHFLLFICDMEMISDDEAFYDEEILKWFPVNNLDKFEGEIIPSDLIMIKNFIINKSCNYFECVLGKKNNKYSIVSTKYI